MSTERMKQRVAKSGTQSSSPLLINEPPLQVLPSLAKLIGLNEAIVLQQLHYWLQRSRNEFEGHLWVYNTYKEWCENNFPFWEVYQLRRIFINLEARGLVISRRFEAQDWKQRKWYRIDHDALGELIKRAKAA